MAQKAKPKIPDGFLTIREFAERAGVSVHWVHQMLWSKTIEGKLVKADRLRWVIPISELERRMIALSNKAQATLRRSRACRQPAEVKK